MTTSPAPSDSPSPEQSTVVVAPERPAAMDDDGPQGAEAAVKYFLALDSYMQATGDTTAWDAMSEADCVFCAGRREQAQEIAASNHIWDGGESTVQINHTYAQDAATGTWVMDISFAQDAAIVTDEDGAVISEVPSRVADVRVAVARVDGAWLFIELEHPAG